MAMVGSRLLLSRLWAGLCFLSLVPARLASESVAGRWRLRKIKNPVHPVRLFWRRERDSNPRCRFWQHTRFPVVLLQPARTSLREQLSSLFNGLSGYLAERVGFEPTIPFLTEYRFSRAGPSAARQPLRCFQIIILIRFQYNFLIKHVNNIKAKTSLPPLSCKRLL